MAWNFTAATQQGGGGGATFTLNGIDTNGEYKRIKAWIHSKAFLGRHGGPIPNPENLSGTGLTGVLEPSDIDGVGGLVKRTNTWDGAGQGLVLRAGDAPRAAGERRVALRTGRRHGHLRRRPQLLRRQGRVLQVEGGRRRQHPRARCCSPIRWCRSP